MKKLGISTTWGSKYEIVLFMQEGTTCDSDDNNDLELNKHNNRLDAGKLNVDNILDFDSTNI